MEKKSIKNGVTLFNKNIFHRRKRKFEAITLKIFPADVKKKEFSSFELTYQKIDQNFFKPHDVNCKLEKNFKKKLRTTLRTTEILSQAARNYSLTTEIIPPNIDSTKGYYSKRSNKISHSLEKTKARSKI